MKSNSRIGTMFLLALLLAFSAVGVSPASPVYASSYVVNTLDDLDDSSCNGAHCSLREAIDAANLNPGSDTITFSVSGTIRLSSMLPGFSSAVTTGSLIIDGGGNIIISGDTNNDTTPDVAIFSAPTSSQVTIQNLTLEKGVSASGGGAITNSSGGQLTFDHVTFSGNTSTSAGQGGGAIYSISALLTINNCTFSNNSATMAGGAIFIAGGSTQIDNSVFSGNSASTSGGVIYGSNTTIIITGSQFTGNTSAGASGGAIALLGASGNLTVNNSSFTDNQANAGGAINLSSNATATISGSSFVSNDALGNDGGAFYIANPSALTIANSTISGNTTVSRGGGIFAFGPVSLYNTTLSDNTSVSGAGGIHTYNTLNIHNTIIANHIFGDCVLDGGTGVIGTQSNNLIESTGANACDLAGNGNITGSDPNLGTLTSLPAYHPLNNGSAAIDSGDAAICTAAPVNQVDQRGISRPQGIECDRGSYEVTPPTDISLSASSVTEGLPANTTVGTFTTTDPDSAAPFTYTLVSGTGSADNAAFNISGNVLQTSQAFNFLTKNSYSIRVRSTDNDGFFYEKAFAIAITDTPAVFNDVPDSYWAVSYIERLYNAGITGGCSTSPLNYCPADPVTRAQMAVFLLKGIHGSSYAPPAVGGSTGFTDVPTSYWAAAWIKQLATEAITSGCGSGIYCPENAVTRAQMAVFLLKAKHGSSYAPPAAAGVFSDVATTYWAAAWIEQLAAESITSGCAAGLYCPENSVTRDQMAVFLVKAFNLP